MCVDLVNFDILLSHPVSINGWAKNPHNIEGGKAPKLIFVINFCMTENIATQKCRLLHNINFV